jgi:hypothetical protein
MSNINQCLGSGSVSVDPRLNGLQDPYLDPEFGSKSGSISLVFIKDAKGFQKKA